MSAGAVAEVLRGMHVDRQALCVGRIPPSPADTDVAGRAAQAAEEARAARLSAALAEGRREGERAGYEDGLRRGLAEAAAQHEAAVQKAVAGARAALEQEHQSLRALHQSLQDARAESLRMAEDDMVALCFDAVCRIVGEEALAPEHVRARVRRLVAAWNEESGVLVRLNPRDAALLDPAGGGPLPSGVPCVPDPQVAPGDCVVRGCGGGLELRLDASLDACRRALLAVRAQLLAEVRS